MELLYLSMHFWEIGSKMVSFEQTICWQFPVVAFNICPDAQFMVETSHTLEVAL